MNLLQPRLDGHSQCHLSRAQNNQGAGDRGRGIAGKQGGDQKGEGLLWAFARMLHPPPSASSRRTRFSSVQPGIHIRSRPPRSSAPLRSCGCPGKSHGGASRMERGDSLAGRTLGSLGSAVERDPQSGDVLSCLLPLCPGHRLPHTPAASQLHWLGLPGVPKPGFLVPCLEPFQGSHLPWKKILETVAVAGG